MNINYDAGQDQLAPFYLKYSSEMEPQPVFLDSDGTILTSWETGNAIPADVYEGRRIRWQISPYISKTGLQELVEDKTVIYLLDRVKAGLETVYRNGNYVGFLNNDASNASHDLEEYLSDWDRYHQAKVSFAGDWFGDVFQREENSYIADFPGGQLIIYDSTMDQELEVMDEVLLEYAAEEGVHIDGGCESFLCELREDLREDLE